MSKGCNLSKASEHRRHAAACGLFAANARSEADRELLLRMQRSALERAWHEDSLGGLPPMPPVQLIAMRAPPRSPPPPFVLRSVKAAPEFGPSHGRL